MKYIQSFYQYSVTFSSIGKTIPSKDAEGDLRNIAEITENELEALENKEPMFRTLINQKKYRVLNKLPESYKPASTLVNEARAKTEAAKAEIEELKAKLAEKENKISVEDLDNMTVKELQQLASKLGLNIGSKATKAELIQVIQQKQE